MYKPQKVTVNAEQVNPFPSKSYKILFALQPHRLVFVSIAWIALCENLTKGIHALSSKSGGTSSTPGGEVLATKSFPLQAEEPSCEQLRAMWIFSKRQSRAAELTNEIPTYRDPFTYNIWRPFYKYPGNGPTRQSINGIQTAKPRHNQNTRSPIFGRVVSQEPVLTPQFAITFGNNPKLNPETEQKTPTRKLQGQYRLISGPSSSTGSSSSTSNGQLALTNPNILAMQGSFHKLKELIWTERAKELTKQRRLEELAARASVLKEIANGQNVKSPYKQQLQSELMLMDGNRSPEMEVNNAADNSRRFNQRIQEPISKPRLQTQTSNRAYSRRVEADRNKAYAGRFIPNQMQRPFIWQLAQQNLNDLDNEQGETDEEQESDAEAEEDAEAEAEDEAESEAALIRGMNPQWRSSAGFARKYAPYYKTSRGGDGRTFSHFRERQRALFKEKPGDKIFNRRVARRLKNSENSDYNHQQAVNLQEILQQLKEYNNNDNNNNNKNENNNDNNFKPFLYLLK